MVSDAPPIRIYQIVGCILQFSISVIIIVIITHHLRKKAIKNKNKEELAFKPNQPSPPPGLSILEIAELEGVYLSANTRVAGLIELAVDKHISIFHIGNEWKIRINDLNISQSGIEILKFFMFNKTTKNFQIGQYYLLEKHTANDNLIFYETQVIKMLESKGIYEVGQDKTIKNKEGRDIVFWHSVPDQSVKVKLVLGIFIINTLFVLAIRAPLSVIIYIISMISLFPIGKIWNKYENITNYGIQMRNYISGFKDYLKTVEAQKTSSISEIIKEALLSDAGELVFSSKMLPYIVLFNMDTTWVEQFGDFVFIENNLD